MAGGPVVGAVLPLDETGLEGLGLEANGVTTPLSRHGKVSSPPRRKLIPNPSAELRPTTSGLLLVYSGGPLGGRKSEIQRRGPQGAGENGMSPWVEAARGKAGWYGNGKRERGKEDVRSREELANGAR
ncbi:hypothetical protein KM043_009863 [Ampulex compressa]|nr:hypothetical protein KM043_009863 [Ampulex compressa]